MANLSSQDRRARLLEAAAALVVQWGFDKTSVDDIASEAGVSKGAVYLEFPSKEAIFQAMLLREFSHYVEDWLRRFENDGEEWDFARMVRHSILAIHANPVVKALMTRDKRMYGNFLRQDTRLMASSTSANTALFLHLQKLGALRSDLSPKVLAYLISAMSFGLIAGDEAIPEESRVDFEEAVDGFGQLLNRALSPDVMQNRAEARTAIIEATRKLMNELQAEPVRKGQV